MSCEERSRLTQKISISPEQVLIDSSNKQSQIQKALERRVLSLFIPSNVKHSKECGGKIISLKIEIVYISI